MSTIVRKSVAVFALLLLSSAVALAQRQGKLTGAVKDADGAGLAGVEVLLVESLSAVVKATVTDASGNFSLENIYPGNYEVSVAKAGFANTRLRSGSLPEVPENW